MFAKLNSFHGALLRQPVFSLTIIYCISQNHLLALTWGQSPCHLGCISRIHTSWQHAHQTIFTTTKKTLRCWLSLLERSATSLQIELTDQLCAFQRCSLRVCSRAQTHAREKQLTEYVDRGSPGGMYNAWPGCTKSWRPVAVLKSGKLSSSGASASTRLLFVVMPDS